MFKAPSAIAQDLLLIQDLVAEPQVVELPTVKAQHKSTQDDYSIDSSDSDNDSEIEIEADLLIKEEEADVGILKLPVSPSVDSDSDSSDSDSESVRDVSLPSASKPAFDEDEDEEPSGPPITSAAQVRTKNEVPDLSVVVPDITEVGPEELLEKVGEVMSVLDNMVIVKGLASKIADQAAESVLDSDSLLVFDDRKVLGYVYETFGPTHQPLYQIKFTSSFPLDAAIAKISRPVFHVPQRSRFVFPSQLRKFKGCDASNIHDEEVGDHEVEFSDDEAEAEHKRNLKERRAASRAGSVASSRFSTPTPSQMHDQDMTDDYYGASPYEDMYDMDSGPGPSRPAPMPYDDPYREAGPSLSPEPSSPSSPRDYLKSSAPVSGESLQQDDRSKGRGRGRGRGRDSGGPSRAENARGRGRGRGRERPRGRNRGGREASTGWGPSEVRDQMPQTLPLHESHPPRPLSPTSLAIARATGQYQDGTSFIPNSQALTPSLTQTPEVSWPYQQHPVVAPQPPYNPQYQYQQQYVQPHINPRFASLFGINMDFAQPQQYPQYVQSGTPTNPPVPGGGNTWSGSRDSGSRSNGAEYAVPIQDEEYRP